MNNPTLAAQIEALASVDVAYNGPLVALIRTNLPAIVTALRRAEAAPTVDPAEIALSAYNQGYRDGSEDSDGEPDMECARDGWHDWLHGCAALKQGDDALDENPQAEAAPGVVEAVKAEIERQCGIGAGTCKRDPETGLIEVHADIDANGFAEAMTLALALALARQHGAREGYVLVPRKPTDAMTNAGVKAWLGINSGKRPDWDTFVDRTFSAMIAAAPATDVGEAS